MHDHHKGHSHEGNHDSHENENSDVLRKLQVLLEHWIEHGDSHVEAFREWAEKAAASGEEEIAREIQHAISESASVKGHLKRAGAIAAAKLVLRK